MSDYHTIRLHGPWQADFFSPGAQDLTNPDAVVSRQRIRLPINDEIKAIAGESSPSVTKGQIVLSRHFNWPHGSQQPVFLHVDSNIDWTISLNGKTISKLGEPRAESISNHLVSRNQLRLSTELRPHVDIQIGEVSLKVSESSGSADPGLTH